MLLFVLSAELIAWIVFTLGFCSIGTEFPKAKKLKKQLWNMRVDKLGKPPYSAFMRAYAQKRYWKSAWMVLACNAPMHLLLFLLGYLKIGVVILVVQPFLMGALVGMGDDKTRLWGVLTAVFEVTGFVVSVCLGAWGALRLWWVPALLLALNALVEAGGALAGVRGVPGMQAVRNREYLE